MEENIQKKSKHKVYKDSKNKVSFLSIFQANSGGISSKRVAGLLGWISCLVIFFWAFIVSKEVPEFGDLVVIMSSSLLGIESVTQVFQKRINK